jgi:hypothetical protein
MKKATALGRVCQLFIFIMIAYNGQESNGEVAILESKVFSRQLA